MVAMLLPRLYKGCTNPHHGTRTTTLLPWYCMVPAGSGLVTGLVNPPLVFVVTVKLILLIQLARRLLLQFNDCSTDNGGQQRCTTADQVPDRSRPVQQTSIV